MNSRVTLVVAAVSLVFGAMVANFVSPVASRPAADVLRSGTSHASPVLKLASWQTKVDTVKEGDLLVTVLQNAGVDGDDAALAVRSATSIDPRKIQPGMTVTTRFHVDSGTSDIRLQVGEDRVIRLRRDASALSSGGEIAWIESEEILPWTTDTVVVSGVITSTLTDALERGGDAFPVRLRDDVAYALADILEYKVDLSRDLRVNDSVQVLVEKLSAPTGAVRAGNILAARLTIGGKRVETVRFDQGTKASSAAYFDGDGSTMRAAFLKAPLAFRRISSVFGLRKHPILGVWRAHQGTDYSASAGTPIRALGAGTVIFAGWKGGYGRVVEIRHRNGYVTRYGHMSGFASGIKRGASVDISRTIGFVGASGLATAPHLHFEVLIGGVHRDPRVALKNVSGESLASPQLAKFKVRRDLLFSLMDREIATGVSTHALANSGSSTQRLANMRIGNAGE